MSFCSRQHFCILCQATAAPHPDSTGASGATKLLPTGLTVTLSPLGPTLRRVRSILAQNQTLGCSSWQHLWQLEQKTKSPRSRSHTSSYTKPTAQPHVISHQAYGTATRHLTPSLQHSHTSSHTKPTATATRHLTPSLRHSHKPPCGSPQVRVCQIFRPHAPMFHSEYDTPAALDACF